MISRVLADLFVTLENINTIHDERSNQIWCGERSNKHHHPLLWEGTLHGKTVPEKILHIGLKTS